MAGAACCNNLVQLENACRDLDVGDFAVSSGEPPFDAPAILKGSVWQELRQPRQCFDTQVNRGATLQWPHD